MKDLHPHLRPAVSKYGQTAEARAAAKNNIFAPRTEGEKLGDRILTWLLWAAVIGLIGYDIAVKVWL